MTTLSQHVMLIRRLLELPVAHLQFHREIAPEVVPQVYRYYTQAHPKYKLIQHKSWGAALLDLHACPTLEDYLERIKGKNNGAFHARRARSRGYVVQDIDRNNYLDDIHAIHTSLAQRQGRPMDPQYQTRQAYFDSLPNFQYVGVVNAEGKLMAYANVGHYGNFSAFSHLMGYRNNDGIMHLLVVDIVARLLGQPALRYLMYDTFFGALPGLQQFKTMVGFSPYRAKYSLL